jgi:alkylation response protein AidB-like acyl-CoA dehydrogenase
MIREAARDFAQNEIAPIAAEFDESGEFPHAKTIKKMGEMGFMGIEVPKSTAAQAWIPWRTSWPWRRSAKPTPRTARSCRSTTRSSATAS